MTETTDATMKTKMGFLRVKNSVFEFTATVLIKSVWNAKEKSRAKFTRQAATFPWKSLIIWHTKKEAYLLKSYRL